MYPNDSFVEVALSGSDLKVKKSPLRPSAACGATTIPVVDDPLNAALRYGIQLANPVGQPPTSSDIDIWDRIPNVR